MRHGLLHRAHRAVAAQVDENAVLLSVCRLSGSGSRAMVAGTKPLGATAGQAHSRIRTTGLRHSETSD